MLVIDAFPGNDETRLAELRIEYLSSVVDFTVICESSLSHSGKAKPLFFAEWLKEAKNKKFLEKVIVIEVDLAAHPTAMARDVATREHLAEYIRTNFPNSYFILSDLDEIPSTHQIDYAVDMNQNFHFLTPTSYLYANWQLKDSHRNWSRGVIGLTSIGLGPNGGRFVKWPVIEKHPGVHLSWMLGISGNLMPKLSSTAHEELESQNVLNAELTAFAAKFGIDHLGRFYNEGFGLLIIQDENRLTDVQKFIHQRAPDFFKFELELNLNLIRWISSAVCTAIWTNPKHSATLHQTFIKRNFSVLSFLFGMVFLIRTILFGILHFLRRKYRLLLNLR